jgi:hypothetical protein
MRKLGRKTEKAELFRSAGSSSAVGDGAAEFYFFAF